LLLKAVLLDQQSVAMRGDVDRQSAVHDTRMQLHRHRQTDGEPDGSDAD
jgi:hypothetical protein